MQIVYLSARPAILHETVEHVRHFTPWLDDVVVVAPAAEADAFEPIGTVLTDEDVTGRTTDELAALDHTTRNHLLRTSMIGDPAIDAVFVMSDDDSRPLVPLGEDAFVDGGRHRRRWFHTMAGWGRHASDFDAGLLHTWIILRQLGLADPLSYASHMPQVIDRDLFGATAERFAPFAADYALDEWSTYFNFAPTIEPERFVEPEPFVTLGWPRFPGEWPHQVSPPRFEWENHHAELHQPGGLYDGLPTGCDPASIDATNLEKIIRWHRLEIDVRSLDFPDDVDQPWTSPSAGRRLAFRGLRAARGAYRYISLDERTRIAELEGRIRRLEDERLGRTGA